MESVLNRDGVSIPIAERIKTARQQEPRRKIPTPNEWQNMKLMIEQMEQGEIKPNLPTCSILLTACSDMRALPEGKRMHKLLAKNGLENSDKIILENNIIQMYIRCGKIDLAMEVFRKMHRHDVISVTSLISAYTQSGHIKEAFLHFQTMLQLGICPDKVAFRTIINTAAALGSVTGANLVHSCLVECGLDSDTIVGTSIIGMYTKCSKLQQARRAFDRIHVHDPISWTAMITAYSESSKPEDALLLFHKMVLEGMHIRGITLASAINACGDLHALHKHRGSKFGLVQNNALEQAGEGDLFDGGQDSHLIRCGRMLHALAREVGVDNDPVVATALVTMYSRCNELAKAKAVFDRTRCEDRDVVLWTAMIGAYAEHRQPRCAFELFERMQDVPCNIKPNRVTFLALVNACSEKAVLPEARKLHLRIKTENFDDSVIGSTVVAMYGRCGSIRDARETFEGLRIKCVVAWNAIAAVHAQNGDFDESLELLYRMHQEGVDPNSVTFTSVLSVLGHAGMVEEGCKLFVTLAEDHRIEVTMEHYGCVVDMLGRAGWLEDAESFVRRMPLKADQGIWKCLLGACKMYGDSERSERIAEKVMEVEPRKSEAYVVLSNSLKA